MASKAFSRVVRAVSIPLLFNLSYNSIGFEGEMKGTNATEKHIRGFKVYEKKWNLDNNLAFGLSVK